MIICMLRFSKASDQQHTGKIRESLKTVCWLFYLNPSLNLSEPYLIEYTSVVHNTDFNGYHVLAG